MGGQRPGVSRLVRQVSSLMGPPARLAGDSRRSQQLTGRAAHHQLDSRPDRGSMRTGISVIVECFRRSWQCSKRWRLEHDGASPAGWPPSGAGATLSLTPKRSFMRALFDIRDKVALVTGGSRGIGELNATGSVEHDPKGQSTE